MSTLQQIKAFEDTISVTDLRKNLAKVYKRLKKDHEVVITKKQDVLGVLVDKDTYEKRENLIHELQEKLEYHEIHAEIMKTKQNNKTYSEEEIRKKLKKF